MRKAKEGVRGEFALCIHSLGVGPRLPKRSARTHKTRQNRKEGKEVVKTKQVGSREQKCLYCGIFSKWRAYDTRGSRLPTCKAPRPLPACRFRLLPPFTNERKRTELLRLIGTSTQDDLQDGAEGDVSCAFHCRRSASCCCLDKSMMVFSLSLWSRSIST